MLLCSSAMAVSTQVQPINASTTEVPVLVNVTGNLAFNDMLPGYNYASNITVSWAVPQDALSAIQTNQVILYVAVTPQSSGSWAYIQLPDGTTTQYLDFTLSCALQSGNCGSGSILSQTFTVFMKVPPGAAYPHSDGLVVNASLQPITSDQYAFSNTQRSIINAANNTVTWLTVINETIFNTTLFNNTVINTTLFSDLVSNQSAIRDAALQAQSLAQSGQLSAAQSKLAEAEAELEGLNDTINARISALNQTLSSGIAQAGSNPSLQLPASFSGMIAAGSENEAVIAVILVILVGAYFAFSHFEAKKRQGKKGRGSKSGTYESNEL